MKLDIRVLEIPPAPHEHELKHALPVLVVGGAYHSPENPAVGSCAEQRRTQDAVEVLVGASVIGANDVARPSRGSIGKMGLEPALPVRMTYRAGGSRARQLQRNEEIVGNGVGREVGEIA